MLIDWLTLRIPLTLFLGEILYNRIKAAMGKMVKISADGEVVWTVNQPDWDAIRSDSMGLYWSVTCDKDSQQYLTIGASPSSLVNDGVNVFGSMDVEQCSKVLIETAGKSLGAILPDWKFWQCRRMDLTANYDMGNAAQVKQALRLLLATDAPCRKTNSDMRGGDTVYWNPKSDLQAGKAYHKGAHIRYQLKKGNIFVDAETCVLADRLLRLELKLGSRFFRRLDSDWHDFQPEFLTAIHFKYFSQFIGGGDVEVFDMNVLLEELKKVAPTKGRALAAHRTWALIKSIGFSQTKASMPYATFNNHLVLLRKAGLSSADLCAGKVIEFRRKSLILCDPVHCWDDLRCAA